jgi:membrane associated rhomboid family serine protease
MTLDEQPLAPHQTASGVAEAVPTERPTDVLLNNVPPDTRLRFTLLTAAACAICLIVFVALIGHDEDTTWTTYERWGYLSPETIWHGGYWGLVTSAFVHLDPLHLVLNLFWLWILGGALERSVGPIKWLVFFVTAAWVSSGIELLSGDTGIGISGVGYALFGFGWIARERYPAFREAVQDRTVRLFLSWLVLCFFLTAFGIMRVANGAHLGGLLFGVAVAEIAVRRRKVALVVPGLVLLAGLSVLPLFWLPWSGSWVAVQATEANKRENYDAAIKLYRRSLELGEDPAWVWRSLAEIYGYQERAREYADALGQLRRLDENAAKAVEADYGSPEAVGTSR